MDVVAIFKALGDSSRLNMIKEILKGSVCAEELCENLKLAPSTISHHANKLVKAGLVEIKKEQQVIVYEINESTINEKLRDLILMESNSEITDGRKDAYQRKVIHHFIENSQLKKIPVQRKKRRIVLEHIAEQLETKRKYSEIEISEILKSWHEDYCFLRREMISENLLARKSGLYWRI